MSEAGWPALPASEYENQPRAFGRAKVRGLSLCQNSLRPCEYLALSYVWGSNAKQSFLSRNEDSIAAQRHLVDLCLPNWLPQTLEDAIRLTQLLGHRSLWVDALCIIQDNYDHKEAQIARMGHVYSGAVTTIAAAGGEDTEAALPVVKPEF